MLKKILMVLSIVTVSYLFPSAKEKIAEINKEIEYLEEVKRGFESKAAQYENMAQELQFQNNNLQDAKRYWRMADANKEAAKEVEKKIEAKKKERDKLTK